MSEKTGTITVTLSQPMQRDITYSMPVEAFIVKQYRPIDYCPDGGIGLLRGGLDLGMLEVHQHQRAGIARDIANAIFKAMCQGDTLNGYPKD